MISSHLLKAKLWGGGVPILSGKILPFDFNSETDFVR